MDMKAIRGGIQGQKPGLRTSYGSKIGMEVIKEISSSESRTTHHLWIENGHGGNQGDFEVRKRNYALPMDRKKA